MPDFDAITHDVQHRPWPLPSLPWIMFQRWERLLFAHWKVATDLLRPLVPSQLELDDHQGSTYVSVTPFELRGLRMRFLPPFPFASNFPEVNFRTYVRFGGKPGIFFFSLDAASRLAVTAARLTYQLPYHVSDMHIAQHDDSIEYRSKRLGTDAELVARYRPLGSAYNPTPHTLDHFLTERYALYVVLRSGRVMRGDIHHRPWSLQQATAEVERLTIPAAHGISLSTEPEMLRFARRQDTVLWPLVPA